VRNVGSTFELEPNIFPDGTVSLQIAPEVVRFIDFLHYGEGNARSLQPVFHSTSSQSNLRVLGNG
jgi:hypothetical protein